MKLSDKPIAIILRSSCKSLLDWGLYFRITFTIVLVLRVRIRSATLPPVICDDGVDGSNLGKWQKSVNQDDVRNSLPLGRAKETTTTDRRLAPKSQWWLTGKWRAKKTTLTACGTTLPFYSAESSIKWHPPCESKVGESRVGHGSGRSIRVINNYCNLVLF